MNKRIWIIGLFILLSLLCISCGISDGNDSKGVTSNASNYFNKQIGDKLTDVELIDTVHVDEWVHAPEFNLDGATFWKGKTKTIPAHDILYFRGYSSKLDSYVFMRYNDDYNEKDYSLVPNYDIEKEKADAKTLLSETEKILSNKNIRITTVFYTKFERNADDIDSVYKLPKEFYQDYPYEKDTLFISSQNILWITIKIDKDIDEITRSAEPELAGAFEKIGYGISMEIVSPRGGSATYYKGFGQY